MNPNPTLRRLSHRFHLPEEVGDTFAAFFTPALRAELEYSQREFEVQTPTHLF